MRAPGNLLSMVKTRVVLMATPWAAQHAKRPPQVGATGEVVRVFPGGADVRFAAPYRSTYYVPWLHLEPLA